MLSPQDKTNNVQKGLAFVILAGLVWGVVTLLNAIMPSINELLENIWVFLAYAVPLFLVGGYILTNPLVIWGLLKTLSYKLTSWIIKMDPLSVMDRYVEYLRKKLASLLLTIQVLVGKRSSLKRQIADLEKNIDANGKKGAAALEQGKTKDASLFGIKVKTDQNTLAMLRPLEARMDKSLNFLQLLAENWEYGIESLTYQIEGKRKEYEIVTATVKGLKTADDFINSDNEAAKLYGMGLKALEEDVTQKIGYIEEFERRSKDIMSGIEIEKAVIKDEGLKELEKYMQSNDLLLPNFETREIQDISYQTINSSNGQVSKKKYLKA